MKSHIAAWGVLLAGLLAIAARGETTPDFLTDSPAASIATLQRGLLRIANEHPDATTEERYRLLEPWIKATHDLGYIAEFSLRRQWPMLTEIDRARFVSVFERLSVMTYAARFTGVGPNTFAPIVQGSVDTNGRAQVSTGVARADGSEVPLEYLLANGPHGWRIVNVVADGVSDLALKRAEYQRVLSGGDIDALIAELETQIDRLRGG